MNYPPSDEMQFDLLDLSGFFSRRKGWLIFGVLIGLLLAALHYGLTPPVFRAEMEILVGERSGDLARGATADASTEGVQAEQDILSTHIRVMSSRRVIAAAIEKHGLDKLPSVEQAVQDDWSAVAYVQENLNVEKGGDGVVGDAHVLVATYDDPSPVDCAVILQAVYDEYSAYLKSQFEGTSTDAIKLFTDLVKENAESVLAAEAEIANELAGSQLLWDGERSRNIHKERLQQVEDKLSELAATRSETESRLRVIQQFLDDSKDTLVTDLDRLALLSENEVSRLKLLFEVTRGDTASEAFQAEQPIRQQAARAEYEEYLALKMKEKKLLEKFNEGHPTVESVREQIEMMRQFIDTNSAKIAGSVERERMRPEEMLRTYVGLLNHDLADLNMQVEVLNRQSEIELAQAKKLETTEMRVDSLRREIMRKKEIYDNSKNTLSELNFVRDYAGFSTDVIGVPEPQDKQNWPQLPISAAVGLMIGGLLGLGLAVAAELADQTFRSVEDLEALTQSDVIAHVPAMKNRVLRSHARRDSRMNPVLTTFHSPRGRSSEIYRVARTSLLMQANKSDAKVFCMSSPAPSDGKSTSISNLAVSLAQTGKRVLVIDADLRRPTLDRVFGVENQIGLVDIVQGDAVLDDAVNETEQENLCLLTRGSSTERPSELLEAFAFESLIRNAEDRYDFVLIDTPPILSVTDPLIVGKIADLLVLTVTLGRKGRPPVAATCKLLRQADLVPAAVIVNKVDTNSQSYGYTQGYGYQVDAYSDHYYSGYEPTAKPNSKSVGEGVESPASAVTN